MNVSRIRVSSVFRPKFDSKCEQKSKLNFVLCTDKNGINLNGLSLKQKGIENLPWQMTILLWQHKTVAFGQLTKTDHAPPSDHLDLKYSMP